VKIAFSKAEMEFFVKFIRAGILFWKNGVRIENPMLPRHIITDRTI
jgi:hypothetical protein